ADLRGKVVILHFWATWCIACRHEMPQLEALWRQHREEMAVLGINVDRGNRSGVARFVKEYHVGFPSVLDAAGTVRHRYRIRALPTSYLIGRDGRMIGRIVGERDWGSPAARKMIDTLVGKGEIP
ncbi:MAG TPA: TlpA disulfide reductase family protein, partial [Mariprofundaceae bacterium]|nr:TlpA disulfide reductase family protein [Mariprofundaceae bacterium]